LRGGKAVYTKSYTGEPPLKKGGVTGIHLRGASGGKNGPHKKRVEERVVLWSEKKLQKIIRSGGVDRKQGVIGKKTH